MSRVLVFGGDGLLGSHLYLALRHSHELGLTLHSKVSDYPQELFSKAQVFLGVAAGDKMSIADVLKAFRPGWVINAIGLAKRPLARDPYASLEANTLFPHLLAQLCAEYSARLLHFSTDGVFSGRCGQYSEESLPDCRDWYGRCKFLGEPSGANVLVLRTAFVGLELGCKLNLVEWFLAQRGHISGYRKAIWSGLTAIELGRLVNRLIETEDPLRGVWHVSAPAISKFEFLSRLNDRITKRKVVVVPDDSLVCDRSLDGSAFCKRVAYSPPAWDVMLDELAVDIEVRWASSAPSYWAI